MTEEQFQKRSDNIIEALTALSLGQKPNLLSNSIFRKLANHPYFLQIRDTYIEYLKLFEGKVSGTNDISRLFEMRKRIVELFDEQ